MFEQVLKSPLESFDLLWLNFLKENNKDAQYEDVYLENVKERLHYSNFLFFLHCRIDNSGTITECKIFIGKIVLTATKILMCMCISRSKSISTKNTFSELNKTLSRIFY